MTRFAIALLPLALVLFLLEATRPSADSTRPDHARIAAGAELYANTCAPCHAPTVEWTQGGCRPAPLAGVAERYEKEQVMNLLDHGVMLMPSFATMPQGDRDLIWEYLSSLPADPETGPTPGQFCRRVKAAMAGTPMAAGCGGTGAGQGAGCGGGQGGGCGGAKAGGCGGGQGGGCGGAKAGGGGCGGGADDAPMRRRRGWSFGR